MIDPKRLQAVTFTSTVFAPEEAYVDREEREMQPGESFVCENPHDDGDLSYCCGSDYCRCMQ